MTSAYIVQAVRTAGGRRNGRLSGWHPVDLAAQVLDALVDRSGVDPAAIDDVLMGCVMQVGEQAVNVGRNAVLASARLPEHVPATTIDRQCGSSQQTLQFAAQAVMSGTQDLVIAAGVESMTRVPMFSASELARKAGMGFYMSPRMRQRYPGIEFSQFMGAEMIARSHGFSREDCDAYALLSHQRAIAATQSGAFAGEILPLPAWKQGEEGPSAELHAVDEGIRFDASPAGISGVKLLQEGGVVSAANASQIADGAAGVLVASEAAVRTHNLKPIARIHHLTVLGGDPVVMLETPLPATALALKRAGMRIGDIDAYEVNEAFAPVPLAWLKATGADPARLNQHGGAIALGHPLGASGARLMTTLLGVLQRTGGRYGLQTMCEGGGMANVTIVEALR